MCSREIGVLVTFLIAPDTNKTGIESVTGVIQVSVLLVSETIHLET